MPTETKEMLEESDKSALNKAKMNMQLAIVSAEKAIAQNDVAKLAYSNLLLQFALKYSLTNKDVIQEDGEIVRGGAPATAAE